LKVRIDLNVDEVFIIRQINAPVIFAVSAHLLQNREVVSKSKRNQMSQSQPTLEGYQFLNDTVSTNRLQSEARNILDSYSHTWDILAESLQNSVDAVEQKIKEDASAKATIRITFDAHKRSIEVSDTGVGMSPEQVKKVLAPHQGYKRGKGLRGEKGVGLSFIMFLSNRFRIETCDGEQTISLEIHHANNWVNGTEDKDLHFTNVAITSPQTFLGSPTYTRIWAEQIPVAKDTNEDVFDYTKPRLEYILRTKTAVGNTHPLFNKGERPPIDINVQLKHIDNQGVHEDFSDVPYSFAAPGDMLKSKDVLSWEEFSERRVQGKSTESKGLTDVGIATSDSGKAVKWYTFISQRGTFDELSETLGLQTDDSKDVDAGIYISTRGMPTGIRLAPPRSQQASYWPSFFILLEYDDLRLDMGRKFVGGRVSQMLTKVALKKIFDAHVNAVPRLTTRASDPFDGLEADVTMEQIKTDVSITADLDLAEIPYMKVPREEQGVVAIFHELLGAGLLKGYRVLRSSSHERYDTYMNYKPDPSVTAASLSRAVVAGRSYNIFAEFKFEAGKTLLEDFDLRKRPKDFKLLICWSIDKAVFVANSIEIKEVALTESVFHGATHKLIFPNSYGFGAENTLHVIVLQDLIEVLKST